MKKVLLKTEKLSKSFSNGGAMQHVLKNIDLQLYQGDFTVIMGASGAGKSTLLYAYAGEDHLWRQGHFPAFSGRAGRVPAGALRIRVSADLSDQHHERYG